MKKIIFNNQKPERIDSFLSHQLHQSRSYITRLLDLDLVMVNQKIIKKASFRLQKNQVITIKPLPNIDKNQIPLNIPIIYQDQNLIVIDKPVGLLVHAKNNFDHEYCLTDWIKAKFPNIKDERYGLIHRLDRLTSGVMIIGLNLTTINDLKKQFKERRVKKIYYAVVEGLFNDQKLIIDLPIARSLRLPNKFMIDPNGRSSQTKIEVIKQNINQKLSLLKLSPQTGRTHQLRVHLSYIHHPIIGDILYNKNYRKKSKTRMMLHAYSLTIRLNSQPKTFYSDLPAEFNLYFKNEN